MIDRPLLSPTMAYIDFHSTIHKATKRDYVPRVTEFPKAEASKLGKQWGKDYWDGDCALVEEFLIFCEQTGRLFEPSATGGYWLPLPERPQPPRTRIELASTEREQRKLETTWSPTGPSG